MSGGVDSSVAAAVLTEQGYDVVGVSMRLHETPPCTPDGQAAGCCSLDDFLDARAVADRLGIPHYVIDFAAEFEAEVVSAFASEYRQGRTPLPCALCNERVKFRSLMRRAQGLGAQALATGHYAEIIQGDGGPELWAGVDTNKDQSYFLFGLTPDLLDHLVFPVGHLDKSEVREIAARYELPVAEKAESQELCFVPDGNTAAAVEKLGIAPPAGDIVDADGAVMGRHQGIHHYTVGQRKGLGIAARDPLYVLKVDATTNQVVVGPSDALDKTALVASDVNWLAEVADGAAVGVRIRHRNPATPGRIRHLGSGRVRVELEEPKRAVAPGQAAVFYDDRRVLGGGWIEG
jgi:tRNA-specific 2-thiouridylase